MELHNVTCNIIVGHEQLLYLIFSYENTITMYSICITITRVRHVDISFKNVIFYLKVYSNFLDIIFAYNNNSESVCV